MTLRLSLVALFAFFSAAVANASPWHWVTLGVDGHGRVALYVDQATMRRSGNRVRANLFSIREAALESGEFLEVETIDFDCRGRFYTVVGGTIFDREGNELKSNGPQSRERARRDSLQGTVLSMVCGERRPLTENVEDPVAHALSMLTGRTDVAAAPSTGAESPARPSPPEGADAEGGMSLGTGFFVGPGGLVLTSYHVVRGADEIMVRTASGQMLPATVHRASPGNDLAVLRVDHRPSRYLGFAPMGSAHTGDRVFTLGYPVIDLLGVGEPRFSDGTVSALSGLGGEDNRMQISVPIQPGNSGGPLLNEAGQVVGVIASQAAVGAFVERTGTLPQSINWAVKAEYASPLIGPAVPAPARIRSEAIANARDAVVVIIARGVSED